MCALLQRKNNRARRFESTGVKMEDSQHQVKEMPSKLALSVSILTHVLLLAPVIYIMSLYFQHYSFFSWHPICMSLGVGIVIMEAVFGISGEACLNSELSRGSRIMYHWIMNSVGLALMIIGLVIIVVNKNNLGRYHFTTTHGKLGLSSIVISLAVASFGILANNTRWLYPRVRPVLIKVGHAFGGIAMTILFLATIINGTYKESFPGTETGRNLIFASLFIAGFFIIIKPVLGTVSRSTILFKRSNNQNA